MVMHSDRAGTSTEPSVLLTDLYQLTMAHAYFELGMRETAVFEVFVRRLPRSRQFLVAAGLAQVLEYLEGLQFTAADIGYLATLDLFPQPFLEHLATLRFTGSVDAMPEGTPFFANEPVLRITAPIIEAQMVESRIVNLVHFQTLIASKAARCVLVSQGRRLVDFGLRRAHGAEAAVYAARAAYLAGFQATATVAAGRQFGIPLTGTMAHSFIETHDSEEQAFNRFVATQRHPTTLLIDTYDTERAAKRVVALIQRLKAAGAAGGVRGVRIDSGDLTAQAQLVRGIFDAAGCVDVEITLSGGLDEFSVARLLLADTPVDAFGIGTQLDVSQDAPSLDIVYKLQEYAGRARRKRSLGKETWPGRKQVFRRYNAQHQPVSDLLALSAERPPGEPLLCEVLRDARRCGEPPTLAASRDFCRERLAELPEDLRKLEAADPVYPVQVSEEVQALAQEVDRVER